MHGVHMTHIPGTHWRDASSPYGYGGPLATSANAKFLAECWNAYTEFMFDQRVVAEYVRFHPILGNDRFYGGQIADNREVVVLELNAANLEERYVARVCSTIRKAERQSIAYLEIDLAKNAERFMNFHWTAMREIGVDAFYLFSLEYFRALADTGMATLGICVRESDDGADAVWLAAAIFLEAGEVAEYHLAANSALGKSTGASSVLIDRAARMAQKRGRKIYVPGRRHGSISGKSAVVFQGRLFAEEAYLPDRLHNI